MSYNLKTQEGLATLSLHFFIDTTMLTESRNPT